MSIEILATEAPQEEPKPEKVIGRDRFNELREGVVERTRSLVQPENARKYIEDEMERTGNGWVKSFSGLVSVVTSSVDLLRLGGKIGDREADAATRKMHELMDLARGLEEVAGEGLNKGFSEDHKTKLINALPGIIEF